MQLPTYESNQVESNVLPTPQRPLNDPVAEATEKAGGVLQGIAQQGFELAREERIKADSSRVMDAYVNFSKNTLSLQNDALNKKGKDALNFDPYIAKFDESYQSTRTSLTPEQQRLFDIKTESERIHFETNLQRHANEQKDILNKENAKATVNLEDQKLSTGYLDEANYDIKSPTSQINHLRAAKADELYMNGISDKDPAFKDEINSVTSKAYVDRVKLLMIEHPTEANAFFKAHENEIEPQQREQLSKTVARLGDEQQGMAIALSYFDDIVGGKKNETQITKELLTKYGDKPEVLKVAEAQISKINSQNHVDQVNQMAGAGTKIEAAIDKSLGNGQVISLKLLKSIPEYNELEKLAAGGNEEAALEVNRLHSYVSRTEAGQKRERRQEQIENRRIAVEERRVSKEEREDFMLDISDPETLKRMTDTEITEQGRKHGLKFGQINQLITKRKGLIKEAADPKLNHNTEYSAGLITQILDEAKITDEEQRKRLPQAFRAFVKAKEDELGRPLTDEEIREQGIKGLQWQAGKKGFLGIGKVKGTWASPKSQDTQNQKNNKRDIVAERPEDYDTAGYLKDHGKMPDQSKGQHMTDKYKTPTHLTFSKESKYSKSGQEGGDWKESGKNHWSFTPSAFNLKQHTPQEYMDVWDKTDYAVERDKNGNVIGKSDLIIKKNGQQYKYLGNDQWKKM
jgi:hypothetical protein